MEKFEEVDLDALEGVMNKTLSPEVKTEEGPAQTTFMDQSAMQAQLRSALQSVLGLSGGVQQQQGTFLGTSTPQNVPVPQAPFNQSPSVQSYIQQLVSEQTVRALQAIRFSQHPQAPATPAAALPAPPPQAIQPQPVVLNQNGGVSAQAGQPQSTVSGSEQTAGSQGH
eukprot:394165-Rhodomonas_salina.1